MALTGTGTTIAAMLIVIPGALPPAAVAPELARLLPQHAPTLHGWLRAASARVQAFDAAREGCTPFEAWQLEQAGYQPQPGLPLGAGLGPLRAGGGAPGQPVWLADLAHLALGADQAALLDPALLDLRADESAQLFEAAAPLFADSGFGATPVDAARWRLTLPAGMAPQTASPAAVAGQRLRAWWSQDAAMRPWRRLLNEIQMVWYEHPVNEARAARGAAPINALWLYGGAAPWPPRTPAPARVCDELAAPQRAGDWAAWLDALAALDAAQLAPLAGPHGRPAQPLQLLLLGDDRRAVLTLKPRAGLARWLPAPKHNWNAWWSRPV